MISGNFFANIIDRDAIDVAFLGDVVADIDQIRVFHGEREIAIASREERWATDGLTDGWFRVFRVKLCVIRAGGGRRFQHPLTKFFCEHRKSPFGIFLIVSFRCFHCKGGAF